MPSHEYRVVPAPRRGQKAKGARTPEERFARVIESEMNRMAAEGWEFVRSDTLPCEQKPGWFRRPVTVFQTLLVFRRPLAPAEASRTPMPPPVALTPPTSVSPPAPAASRFTPLPTGPTPANVPLAAATFPGPTLTVVGERAEPPPLAVVGEDVARAPETPKPEPDSRHAAE